MSRLKEKYHKEIRQKLQEQFQYPNDMLIPKPRKVVLNMCMPQATKDRSVVEAHREEMALISGQIPVVTRSKKSIAGFGLRAGQAIGLKVTLRRGMMWDFIDRFINIDMPRIYNFSGIASKKGDGRGNFSIGIRSQEIFHTLDLDKIQPHPMQVIFDTTAITDEECIALLSHLGMPFKE